MEAMTDRSDWQALLPGPWRRAAGGLAMVSALGVAMLAWRYHDQHGPGRFDLVVYDQLAALGRHEGTLWRISLLGSPLMLVLGTIGLTLIAVLLRRRSAVALALFGPSLAAIITELALKPLVGRTLDDDLAMPSGHTTSVAGLASVAVVLLIASAGLLSVRARALLAAGTALAVAAVAVSMVASQRHYATDTVAGVLVALTVVAVLALLIDSVDWFARPLGGHSG